MTEEKKKTLFGTKSGRALFIICVVGGILATALALFIYSGAGRDRTIIFNKSLDLQVMTVDDTAFTLEDVAFYIAYEEMKVEEDANVYDSTDTNRYWNLHINGEFVRTAAKQHVLDMAVPGFGRIISCLFLFLSAFVLKKRMPHPG